MTCSGHRTLRAIDVAFTSRCSKKPPVPPIPFALYWHKKRKGQGLRQPPQRRQMAHFPSNFIVCYAPPPPPHPLPPLPPSFPNSLHKHTTHNGRHGDGQSAHMKRSSKSQKRKGVQVPPISFKPATGRALYNSVASRSMVYFNWRSRVFITFEHAGLSLTGLLDVPK